MCVSVPGRITHIGSPTARSIPGRVAVGSREIEVDLIMVPEALIGDFVVTHSGYALEIIPRGRAMETMDLLGLHENDGRF
ncbi:MAG TPA: HypC/HybG/HupF family hydrogenase formation chaperone [Acidimicrobiia bacterium]